MTDNITSMADESTKRVENHVNEMREEQFKRLEDSGLFAEFIPMFAKMWSGIDEHLPVREEGIIPPYVMVGCVDNILLMYTGLSLRQFAIIYQPQIAKTPTTLPTFATLRLKRGNGTCVAKPVPLREGTSPGTEVPMDVLDLLYQIDEPMAPVVLFSVAAVALHYIDKGWVYVGAEKIDQYTTWKHPVVIARFTNGLEVAEFVICKQVAEDDFTDYRERLADILKRSQV